MGLIVAGLVVGLAGNVASLYVAKSPRAVTTTTAPAPIRTRIAPVESGNSGSERFLAVMARLAVKR
jgi:hypothetical protein